MDGPDNYLLVQVSTSGFVIPKSLRIELLIDYGSDVLRARGIAPPALRDKGKRKASASPECAMSDEDDSDAEEARILEVRLSEQRLYAY